MIPTPLPALPDASLLVCLLLVLLVPLAIAGLALLNVGLGRSHSAAHALLSSLCAVAVAAVAYIFLGLAVEGYGQPGHSLLLAGRSWNWIGSGHILAAHFDVEHAQPSLVALFQIFAVGLAALIPLSAGADRWRLGAACLSTALLAGWTYPLFAHGAWVGGWLTQLGSSYGLGQGFLDSSGAGVIHAEAGLGALVVTWLLGPRRTKYQGGGLATALPGHNIVLVLFGSLLLLPGWICLNASGAILFHRLPASGIPLVAINTLLAASGASLAAVVLTRMRFGKPDASLSANGWVAGLVASSAASAWLTPFAALLTGVVAGILVIFTVELLELRLAIDDPAGAISVHAVAGIWGLLSLPIFVHNTLPGQMLAQAIGVATLLGLVLPMSYLLNWCANRVYRYRADDDGERQGMDLHELGSGAYPEFVVHRDEFSQR